MTTGELVRLDGGRSFIEGVSLPSEPPTRVYIDGRLYRLSPTPNIPLPPIINVARVILNWAGPAGRLARNIFYLKFGGAAVSSDPAQLLLVANMLMTDWASAAMNSSVGTDWTLSSMTVKDCGGTSAVATSTHSPIVGNAGTSSLPPQSTAVVSWLIAESYRGGKPRTYLPGVPVTALTTPGGSQLSTAFANVLTTNANAFRTAVNGDTITGGGSFTLGTVSYHTGHAVRPTPLFRTWLHARVHERLDSQRRRSGAESLFPVTP